MCALPVAENPRAAQAGEPPSDARAEPRVLGGEGSDQREILHQHKTPEKAVFSAESSFSSVQFARYHLRMNPRDTRAEKYRQKAEEFRVLAHRMSNNDAARMLLDMAQDCLRMAETLEQ